MCSAAGEVPLDALRTASKRLSLPGPPGGQARQDRFFRLGRTLKGLTNARLGRRSEMTPELGRNHAGAPSCVEARPRRARFARTFAGASRFVASGQGWNDDVAEERAV